MADLISSMPILLFYIGVWALSLIVFIFLPHQDPDGSLNGVRMATKILLSLVSLGALIMILFMSILPVYNGSEIIYFHIKHLKPFFFPMLTIQFLFTPIIWIFFYFDVKKFLEKRKLSDKF